MASIRYGLVSAIKTIEYFLGGDPPNFYSVLIKFKFHQNWDPTAIDISIPADKILHVELRNRVPSDDDLMVGCLP